jgi:hypothetical protein
MLMVVVQTGGGKESSAWHVLRHAFFSRVTSVTIIVVVVIDERFLRRLVSALSCFFSVYLVDQVARTRSAIFLHYMSRLFDEIPVFRLRPLW